MAERSSFHLTTWTLRPSKMWLTVSFPLQGVSVVLLCCQTFSSDLSYTPVIFRDAPGHTGLNTLDQVFWC